MYDSRENDKMWLVRHLEILRKNTVEDLRVAKFLCVPCFPPAYNIFEKFVHWYHLAIASHVSFMYLTFHQRTQYQTCIWLRDIIRLT